MSGHPVLLLDENYLATASHLIHSAEKDILISTFKMENAQDPKKYKLAALYRGLEQAVARGIDVKVLLNQLTGKNTIAKTNKYTAGLLKKKSINIRTLENTRVVHAKLIIADEKSLIIGSHNWSNKSFSRNFELSISIDDPETITQARSLFLKLWEEAVIF